MKAKSKMINISLEFMREADKNIIAESHTILSLAEGRENTQIIELLKGK